MYKVPTQQEKQQIDLQRQSFIVNTRLQLAQQFLSTLLGRLDLEVEKKEFEEILPDITVNYANALMTKLGIVLPSKNVE